MKIIIALFTIFIVGCSTSERPKDEDTKLVWAQESQSIEDIFGRIPKSDPYHTGDKGGFWPGGHGRHPTSDCGNNKRSNYRNPNSLKGVNRDGLTDRINTYEVRHKHETLMLVAYKIYGDYSLWREIADLNQDVLGGGIDITPGMLLKYRVPQEGFSFIPEGNPFLVRKGHSLSLISDIVYRDWRRWKEIYAHNQPFIKNSNLIYEGSTLFYVPDDRTSSRRRVKLPSRKRYSNYKSKNKKYRNNSNGSLNYSKSNSNDNKSVARYGNIKGSNSKKDGNSKYQKYRKLSSTEVEQKEIIPVRKAKYSKSNLKLINNIKKAIENTHGNTEINGASKFDRYIEKNFID